MAKQRDGMDSDLAAAARRPAAAGRGGCTLRPPG